MLDDWYRVIRLPITIEEFHQLPRNSAYKYEYLNGQALLTPRPKTLNAILELSRQTTTPTVDAHGPVSFRPLLPSDWDSLPPMFSSSFGRMQPFASLTDEERLHCSEECLGQTRSGGDGPVIDQACFVACLENQERLVGAILITLIPRCDEGTWWSGKWKSPPPPDAAAKTLGRPHLTWVFVAPLRSERGIGSALLAHSVNALLDLGFDDLGTTFLVGNDPSTLWHWRNGFRLLQYPGSMRYARSSLIEDSGSDDI